jgi:hypothetical protein
MLIYFACDYSITVLQFKDYFDGLIELFVRFAQIVNLIRLKTIQYKLNTIQWKNSSFIL